MPTGTWPDRPGWRHRTPRSFRRRPRRCWRIGSPPPGDWPTSGYIEAAERLLLRLFYSFALPEGITYDLIAELHTCLGDTESSTRWAQAKTKLLALTA
ncbi:hypothetical protein [Streptomyces blastmyceticus]|uniref:Uncharacterized protein n=1 Tax=Streptomyces blastmyceticus TaxID=68180 RepID=A0ABP3GV91_9ACTN